MPRRRSRDVGGELRCARGVVGSLPGPAAIGCAISIAEQRPLAITAPAQCSSLEPTQQELTLRTDCSGPTYPHPRATGLSFTHPAANPRADTCAGGVRAEGSIPDCRFYQRSGDVCRTIRLAEGRPSVRPCRPSSAPMQRNDGSVDGSKSGPTRVVSWWGGRGRIYRVVRLRASPPRSLFRECTEYKNPSQRNRWTRLLPVFRRAE